MKQIQVLTSKMQWCNNWIRTQYISLKTDWLSRRKNKWLEGRCGENKISAQKNKMSRKYRKELKK
jgi:uncharacterized low-complexity protein